VIFLWKQARANSSSWSWKTVRIVVKKEKLSRGIADRFEGKARLSSMNMVKELRRLAIARGMTAGRRERSMAEGEVRESRPLIYRGTQRRPLECSKKILPVTVLPETARVKSSRPELPVRIKFGARCRYLSFRIVTVIIGSAPAVRLKATQ
jgi:hypothetical protein